MIINFIWEIVELTTLYKLPQFDELTIDLRYIRCRTKSSVQTTFTFIRV